MRYTGTQLHPVLTGYGLPWTEAEGELCSWQGGLGPRRCTDLRQGQFAGNTGSHSLVLRLQDWAYKGSSCLQQGKTRKGQGVRLLVSRAMPQIEMTSRFHPGPSYKCQDGMQDWTVYQRVLGRLVGAGAWDCHHACCSQVAVGQEWMLGFDHTGTLWKSQYMPGWTRWGFMSLRWSFMSLFLRTNFIHAIPWSPKSLVCFL